MRLENYISDLLFKNDCVIVPDFGAFLTRYQSAALKKDTHTFYPPKKTVGFNRLLIENDGLLEQYLTKKVTSDTQKSKTFLQTEVSNWHRQLNENQFLSLNGLGDFKISADGKWQFVPDADVNFLPTSFGLFPLTVLPVNQHQKEIKRITPTATPLHKPFPAFYKYAAIAVIALGVSGFWGYDYYARKIKQQNFLAREKAEKLLEKKIQQATFEITPETRSVALQIETPKFPYHVVAGAFRIEENAHKKVQELLQKGYKSRLLGPNRYGLHQVAFQSFTNREEALVFLKEIRTQVFQEAWMLIEEL